MRYAATTTVTPEASLGEIRRTLARYEADGFAFAEGNGVATLAFRIAGTSVKFSFPLPDPDDPEFTQTPTGRDRKSKQTARAAYDQAVRQRWRALALGIKAKLELVESGVTTLQMEFLGNMLLGTGETIGDALIRQMDEIELGKDPVRLLGHG